MADRQLKITIRTEIRKGFGELQAQLNTLNKSMEKLGSLAKSIDNLANSMNRVGKSVGNVNQATRAMATSANAGLAVVKRMATEQEKLISRVAALKAAEKSKAISSKQSLETEIRLINQVIKKTGDLSILERRRDSKGRFGYGGLSAAAVNTVKTEIAQQLVLVNALNKTLGAPVTKKVDIKYTSSGRGGVAGAFSPLNTTNLRNRAAGINTGALSLDQSIVDRYNERQLRAVKAPNILNYGGGFGPTGGNIDAVNKLVASYTKLGHILFQIQYSTLTIFGATGIAMIAKQADSYISLRNEVARTSDSIKDLGQNMNDVFNISKSTYSDVNSTGRLFSTVNRYSKATGLDRAGVSRTTQAIAGAFAASPSSPQERSQAMYQFTQALQSNRLGGDELRAILEEAPYVGTILSKGLAKVRGLPAGQVVNLRDGKHAPSAQEITKVFSDPEVLKEIMNTLANRTRTFGDVLQVAKTRMMEYTARVEKGTGLFSGLTNSLAHLISNDKAFDKFVKAIEAATVALIAMGTVAGLQAGASALGKMGGRGASSLIEGMSRGQANRIMNAASWDNLAYNMAAPFKAGAGAVGRFAKSGMEALQFGASAVLAPGPGGGLKAIGAGLDTAIEKVSTFIVKLVPNLLKFAKGLISVEGAAMLIVGVLALVAARFNYLLGKFGDGINIFDIIGGLFKQLMDWVKGTFDFINVKIGGLFSGIVDMLDKVLKWVIGKAKANRYIRSGELERDYGVHGYEHGKGNDVDFRNEKGKVEQLMFKTDKDNNLIKDKDGSLILFDRKSGKQVRTIKNRSVEPNLVTNQKSDLPPQVQTGGHSDPWGEFMRDLNLKAQSLLDLRGVSPQMRDIRSEENDTRRRAMDASNFDSSKYSTLTAAWEAFSKNNAAKAKQVNKLTEEIKKNSFTNALEEFLRSINEALADRKFGAAQAGMYDIQAQRAGNQYDTIKQFMNEAGVFQGNKDDVTNLLAAGNVPGAQAKLFAGMTPENQAKFNQTVNDKNVTDAQALTNAMQKQNQISESNIDLQKQLNKFYGRKRELAEALADIERDKLLKTGGDLSKLTEAQVAAYEQQKQDAIALYDIETKRRQSMSEGFKSALQNYYDEITDLASAMQDLTGKILHGFEDAMVAILRKQKFSWKELFNSILDDVARMFVRQQIIKPLLDKLGLGKLTDMKIQAKNVYINGATSGSPNAGPGGQIPGQGKDGKQEEEQSMFDKWKEFFRGGKDGKNFFDNIQGWFSKIGEFFKGGSDGKGFMANIGDWFKNLFGGKGAGMNGGGSGGGFMATIMNFMKNIFGGGGGAGASAGAGAGNWISTAIQWVASLFHQGGTVGEGGASRVVNPAIFRNAKYYHTGGTVGMPAIGSDEQAAILRKGEVVRTAAQEAALGKGGHTYAPVFSPTVNVEYHSGGGDPAFEQSQADNMGQNVKDAMEQQFNEFLLKQQRPGGSLYGLGRK